MQALILRFSVVFLTLATFATGHAKTHPVTAPTVHQNHGHHEAGVSADQALTYLKNGNVRFIKGHFRKDGRGLADVKKLAAGQKPHTIILSCSDSRVPPEHIFDQTFGEVFVIRVAGQALNDNVIASIEYAVEHLGTQLVVVMGHTQCGAVKAAATSKAGESVGSPALDALVADIKPRLPAYASTTKDLAVESSANTEGIAAELLKRSSLLKQKADAGQIKVKSSLYHLETGKVDWL